MRVFAERAILYSDGLTRARFEASQLVQAAILRNIELTGEAAARVSQMRFDWRIQRLRGESLLPCAINQSINSWLSWH
ncbi:HepT-like ribonuclease domain-containing protein [Synechococcus sp. RedBA-s]|uniref:HepT-like ribonuclease domain-containing protein n=1 Tax=Synechococcus sp. RedBA-s TaxID=2823741 RepID=UPI0037D9D9BA